MLTFDGDKMRMLQKALTPFCEKSKQPRMTSAIHYELQNNIVQMVALNGYEMLVCTTECKVDNPSPDPVIFNLMPFKVGNAITVKIDVPTSTVFVYGTANTAYTLDAPKGQYLDWKSILDKSIEAIRKSQGKPDQSLPKAILHPDRIWNIGNAVKAINAEHVSFYTPDKDYDGVIWKAENYGIQMTGMALPVRVNREMSL